MGIKDITITGAKTGIGAVIWPLAGYWLGEHFDKKELKKKYLNSVEEYNASNDFNYPLSQSEYEKNKEFYYNYNFTKRRSYFKKAIFLSLLGSAIQAINYDKDEYIRYDDYKNITEEVSDIEVSQKRTIEGKLGNYHRRFFGEEKLLGALFSIVTSGITPINFSSHLGEAGKVLSNSVNVTFDGPIAYKIEEIGLKGVDEDPNKTYSELKTRCWFTFNNILESKDELSTLQETFENLPVGYTYMGIRSSGLSGNFRYSELDPFKGVCIDKLDSLKKDLKSQ